MNRYGKKIVAFLASLVLFVSNTVPVMASFPSDQIIGLKLFTDIFIKETSEGVNHSEDKQLQEEILKTN